MLESDPSDEEALGTVLEGLRSGSDPKPYWAFLEKQVERCWGDSDALASLARLMLSKDDAFTNLGLSHRAARRAVELSGGRSAEKLFFLARVLYEGGFPGEAADVMEKALPLEGDGEVQGEIQKLVAYYRRCAEFQRQHQSEGSPDK